MSATIDSKKFMCLMFSLCKAFERDNNDTKEAEAAIITHIDVHITARLAAAQQETCKVCQGIEPICHACNALRAQYADLKATLHYPDCWDTAAYSTVYEALAAVLHSFKCSNDECAKQAAPSDLHAKIMGLQPMELPQYSNLHTQRAYQDGFYDGKSDAAVLVDAELVANAAPDNSLRAIHAALGLPEGEPVELQAILMAIHDLRTSPVQSAVAVPDLSAYGLTKLWQQAQEQATETAPAPFQFARLLFAAPSAPEQPAVNTAELPPALLYPSELRPGLWIAENGMFYKLASPEQPKQEGLTDECAAFEAAITAEHPYVSLEKADGKYVEGRTKAAWWAWQARALLASQPANDDAWSDFHNLSRITNWLLERSAMLTPFNEEDHGGDAVAKNIIASIEALLSSQPAAPVAAYMPPIMRDNGKGEFEIVGYGNLQEIAATIKAAPAAVVGQDAGTSSARLAFILDELASRFPDAHSQFAADPAEPKYLAAIDALLATTPTQAAQPVTELIDAAKQVIKDWDGEPFDMQRLQLAIDAILATNGVT